MARAIRSAVSFLGVSAVAGMVMFGCGGGNSSDGGSSATGGSKATGGKAAVGGTSAATTGITGGKTGAGGASATSTGTTTTGGTSASVGGNTAAVGGTTAVSSGTKTAAGGGGASAGGTTSAVGGSPAVGGASAAGGSTSALVSCDLDTTDVDPLYGTSIFCLPSSTNLDTVNGKVALPSVTINASAGTMTLKGTVTAQDVNRALSLQSPYTDCTADAGPDVSYGLNATDPNTNKLYTGLTLTATNNRTDVDALLVVYLPDLVTAGGKTYYTLASISVPVPKGQTITTTPALTWADVDMYKSDGTTLCSPGGGAFDPTHILGVGVGFGTVGAVDLAITKIAFTQ